MSLADRPTRLLLGDCLERMRELPDASVASVVTDPPYGLGFMGKQWDELPPGEEWARECLRVLRPGGFLLAFGGTRTYHRLVVAIEDAGFEVRDTLAWLRGDGYPKHPSILKPALEPVVVARKRGTGVLNTKDCLIPFRGEADERESKEKNRHADFGSSVRENRVFGEDKRARSEQGNYDAEGRHPSNVILDEEAAELLDEQTGELSAGNHPANRSASSGFNANKLRQGSPTPGRTDVGGASRFFYVAKASQDERHAGLAVPSLLTQDAPERNDHPTVKPIALMRWLVRLSTPAGGVVLDPFLGSGTTAIAAALEGFPWIGIEREPGYMRIAEARISYWSTQPVQAVA